MCLQHACRLLWPSKGYRLSARFGGHDGPLNCFAIIGDAELLVSGGDDELVHVWDLTTHKRKNTLSDAGGRWGQITALRWIRATNGLPGYGLLFIGTGRGRLVVYSLQRRRDCSQFFSTSDAAIFPSGDSVEAIALDPTHHRLAATSHHGTVKMFSLNKDGTPVELWNVNQGEGIPHSVHFLNMGEEILVYTLESGVISCYDTQTATLKSSKSLKTSIGNVDIDEHEKSVVIDNLNAGIDVYPAGRSGATQSFPIPTQQQCVKAAVFCENGAFVAGGSDHGKIYVFDIKYLDSESNQVLTHGPSKSLIQAVATASSYDRHVIVSGSSDGKSDICVWEKPTKRAIQRKTRENRRQAEAVGGALIIIVCLLLGFTWKDWFPTVMEGLTATPTNLRKLVINVGQEKQRELEILAQLGDRLVNLETKLTRQQAQTAENLLHEEATT